MTIDDLARSGDELSQPCMLLNVEGGGDAAGNRCFAGSSLEE